MKAKALITNSFVFVLFFANLMPTSASAGDFSYTDFTHRFEASIDAQNIDTADSLYPQRRFKESHYFFTPRRDLFGLSWDHGPFVAMQSGDHDVFDAVALGWMVEFNRPSNKISGWQIGAGLVAEADFKALAFGRQANDFDNNINRRQSGGMGVILMTSFSF